MARQLCLWHAAVLVRGGRQVDGLCGGEIGEALERVADYDLENDALR